MSFSKTILNQLESTDAFQHVAARLRKVLGVSTPAFAESVCVLVDADLDNFKKFADFSKSADFEKDADFKKDTNATFTTAMQTNNSNNLGTRKTTHFQHNVEALAQWRCKASNTMYATELTCKKFFNTNCVPVAVVPRQVCVQQEVCVASFSLDTKHTFLKQQQPCTQEWELVLQCSWTQASWIQVERAVQLEPAHDVRVVLRRLSLDSSATKHPSLSCLQHASQSLQTSLNKLFGVEFFCGAEKEEASLQQTGWTFLALVSAWLETQAS